MSHINKGVRKILEIPAIYNTFQTLHGGNEKRKQHFKAHFSDPKLSKILDIGCGTGVLLEYLNESVEYHGCDMEESYIQHAQNKFGDRGNFYLERVGETIKPDWLDYFDAINAHGLLHHLTNEDSNALLEIAYKYLKPGGFFLTLDTVYYDNQNPISKWVVSKDRGQNIRTPKQYEALANTYFDKIETKLIKKHNRIMYSVFVMKMFKSV